jgi:hypothetical protein
MRLIRSALARVSTFRAKFNKLNFVQFTLRAIIFPFRVRHISGPTALSPKHDELVVTCLMRNGELHISSFLEHYRSLGVAHFVVLDNGSTDKSIEMLSREDDVTLLQTSAPNHAYDKTMKRFLAKQYCQGHWCLCADIDELFHYPLSRYIPLRSFIQYLEVGAYNAVITQMLDMFSEIPFHKLVSNANDRLREKYNLYDLSEVYTTEYSFGIVPDERIRMHWGGIRKQVFGTDNGLTKVSLFFMDTSIKPFVKWHHAVNARIADVTCVLLHFPFVSSFTEKAKEAVQSQRYGYVTTNQYQHYHNELAQNPAFNLNLPTAQALTDVDDLVQNGFLVVSEKYKKWVEQFQTPEARS